MTDIDPQAPGGPQRRVALFGIKLRDGIWEVTKDGEFFGHYVSDQPAFDAAEAAALAIVANGGAADIRWTDRRPQIAASDRARGLEACANGLVRSMQFRPGSTRIVP